MAGKKKSLTNPFGGEPTYQYDGTGIPFANKDEYLDKALTFSVVDIVFEQGSGYEGADRWVVIVDVSDGRGLEALTFGSNAGRDAAMKEAQECLAAEVPLRDLHLSKSGQAYYINS